MEDTFMPDNSLRHYGVLGMKWGVRRYQNKDGTSTPQGKKLRNKDIRKERWSLRGELTKKYETEYDISGKERAAYAYGVKNRLDLDDGGGGSKRARDAYMKKWDKIEELRDQADYRAKSDTAKILLDKYGQKRMDSISRGEIATGVAVAAAVMAIPLTLMGVVLRNK